MAGVTMPHVWLRRATWLVGGTVLYNLLEAGLAIGAGVAARSIALVGFGLDSVIELAAGLVVLRRLRVEARGGSGPALARTERRVHRFVGVTFLLLAAYVLVQASWLLLRRAAPEESLLGIALAIASTIVMPAIAWGKLRAATALGSRALRAEAKETLACAWLSVTLLLGLVANAALGWWWADPAAALAMVPWLVHEGREALEDECDDDCEP
ncbi:MAG TPA: cation transporter [Longimicrobiales bacterium]|nr:cation transporter [Longimicrobiales bacterium]